MNDQIKKVLLGWIFDAGQRQHSMMMNNWWFCSRETLQNGYRDRVDEELRELKSVELNAHFRLMFNTVSSLYHDEGVTMGYPADFNNTIPYLAEGKIQAYTSFEKTMRDAWYMNDQVPAVGYGMALFDMFSAVWDQLLSSNRKLDRQGCTRYWLMIMSCTFWSRLTDHIHSMDYDMEEEANKYETSSEPWLAQGQDIVAFWSNQ